MALTIDKVKHALDKKAGNLSAAARALGVSRTAIYNKINAHDELKQFLQDKREELVDMAESALLKQIAEGNVAAIIFTLKTQGRERGWNEKIETVGVLDVNFQSAYESAAQEFNRLIAQSVTSEPTREGAE